MRSTFNRIWSSRNGIFIIFLFLIMISGAFLYLDRPRVKSISDLTEIRGTLRVVNQVLVYSKRLNKTERDSTYHIFLNEYPSKFQVSYSYYNRKEFYKTSHSDDSIKLHIAKSDKKYLFNPNKKIRSFSLCVNNKVYLSADQGLSGFGKGYFEIGMILLPMIVIIVLITAEIKKQ